MVDIDIHSLGYVNGTAQWSWKFKGYTCNDCYSFGQGIQPPADSSFCPLSSPPRPLPFLLKAFTWKSQQSSDLKHELDIWGHMKLLVALLQILSSTSSILLADCSAIRWKCVDDLHCLFLLLSHIKMTYRSTSVQLVERLVNMICARIMENSTGMFIHLYFLAHSSQMESLNRNNQEEIPWRKKWMREESW